MAGEQDRDEEQSAGTQPTKQNPHYPTPEFMRLLVELGTIVERQEQHKDRPGDVVPADVVPKE